MDKTFLVPSTKDYLFISIELVMSFDQADASTLKLD